MASSSPPSSSGPNRSPTCRRRWTTRTWVTGDREALRDLVRSKAVTTNHCSGTAKMGPDTDPSAVVDVDGRVYGADGLVVADSSVFPTCPRGNIHFPVVAVAEKIAAGLA